MKTLLATITAALFVGSPLLQAQDDWVSPYDRQNGTHVDGHYRSHPNGTEWDNWSTRGNTNPYTGQQGTRSPDDGLYHYNNNGYYGNRR